MNVFIHLSIKAKLERFSSKTSKETERVTYGYHLIKSLSSAAILIYHFLALAHVLKKTNSLVLSCWSSSLLLILLHIRNNEGLFKSKDHFLTHKPTMEKLFKYVMLRNNFSSSIIFSQQTKNMTIHCLD